MSASARLEARHADLREVEAGPRAADELAETLGGIDTPVNNAGHGTHGSPPIAPPT